MPDILIETNADEVAARFRKAAGDIPDEVLHPVVSDKLANEALRLFRGTTRTWKHAVAFQADTDVGGGSVTVLVGTDDFIYGIVNDGADIPEVKGPLMAFQGGYRAKTTPGSLQSRSGGASGPMVITRYHKAFSIRARNFTKQIHEKISKKAPGELKRAIGRWVRKLT